jgi:hypothetical protein
MSVMKGQRIVMYRYRLYNYITYTLFDEMLLVFTARILCMMMIFPTLYKQLFQPLPLDTCAQIVVRRLTNLRELQSNLSAPL